VRFAVAWVVMCKEHCTTDRVIIIIIMTLRPHLPCPVKYAIEVGNTVCLYIKYFKSYIIIFIIIATIIVRVKIYILHFILGKLNQEN
jgi:hypothetical protein